MFTFSGGKEPGGFFVGTAPSPADRGAALLSAAARDPAMIEIARGVFEVSSPHARRVLLEELVLRLGQVAKAISAAPARKP